jgi:hypothetical protein
MQESKRGETKGGRGSGCVLSELMRDAHGHGHVYAIYNYLILYKATRSIVVVAMRVG